MLVEASQGTAAGLVLHGVFLRSRDGLGRQRGCTRAGRRAQAAFASAGSRAGRGDGHSRGAGGCAGGAGKGAGGPFGRVPSSTGTPRGWSARELIAYAAAGIRSDHESTTVEEARARAALGMLVQVREGSSAQNLDTLIPLLASGELDESWCLVTDDIFPTDLQAQRSSGRPAQTPGRGRRVAGRRGPPRFLCSRQALRTARSRIACAGLPRRSGSGGRSARFPGAHGHQGRARGGARRPMRRARAGALDSITRTRSTCRRSPRRHSV